MIKVFKIKILIIFQRNNSVYTIYELVTLQPDDRLRTDKTATLYFSGTIEAGVVDATCSVTWLNWTSWLKIIVNQS